MRGRWFAPSAALFVRKTGTETVNNSATLQDDDALVLAVEASAIYVVEAQLRYVSGTTPDLKIGWTAPASATFTWAAYGPQVGASSVANAASLYRRRSIGDTEAIGGAGSGGGNEGIANPKGLLVVSTTAGNLQLQWAQNTQDASDTQILADSWLRLQRVA